jgi:hypothetical protein
MLSMTVESHTLTNIRIRLEFSCSAARTAAGSLTFPQKVQTLNDVRTAVRARREGLYSLMCIVVARSHDVQGCREFITFN